MAPLHPQQGRLGSTCRQERCLGVFSVPNLDTRNDHHDPFEYCIYVSTVAADHSVLARKLECKLLIISNVIPHRLALMCLVSFPLGSKYTNSTYFGD